MAILKIVKMGHVALTKKATALEEFGDPLDVLVRDMVETMNAAQGVGLAANQVGLGDDLAIIDVHAGTANSEVFVLGNPVLIESSGSVKEEEGCLSIPGLIVEVERPEKVVVRYQDLLGDEQFLEGTGLLARALCHELDHLAGRLFIQKVPGIRGELARRRAKRMQRSGEWDEVHP